MFEGSICVGCIYHEVDYCSDGCVHESLYDDEGNIIEYMNDIIIDFMSDNDCPLRIGK